ncbi:MAG: hypothetical protein JO022_09595, partial [Acidobacteriaceae bacterium]|nr:hypothetical protein [Acidobacteriaceae bacterium]
AGNAANGDGSFNGDYIYTTSVQLTPAIPAKPTVTTGSVVSAATGVPGPVSPNSWVTIYGTNLGVTTRGWTSADFINGAVPVSLDGVSVVLTLFGAPRMAYVGYVSPTQVNFLLPTDLAVASTTVAVRNAAGTSTPVPLSTQATAPQLFVSNGSAVAAIHADGTAISSSSPAAPGETISIFGSGMGPTTPAQIPGQLPDSSAPCTTTPQVTIGGAAATVASGGVVAGSVGLYQINVKVPANAPNGDLPLMVQIGTATSASNAVISVHN